MIDESVRALGDSVTLARHEWRSVGRPVRLALLSWPVVALLGATVAAAACLLSDCDRRASVEPRRTLAATTATVKALLLRPDSAMLSSVGIDGSIVVWDLAPRGGRVSASGITGPVRAAAFGPHSRFLATARPESPAILYDLITNESRGLRDPDSSSAGAACLAFAPDGATLVIGQQDGLISRWDVATGKRLSNLGSHDRFVASLAFSADGAIAASSGGDRCVRVWDVATSRQRFAIRSNTSIYVALVFSPDGRVLALADQVSPVVWLWDMTKGTKRATLTGAAGAVVSVAISPDGSTLAAADYRGNITFWDLATRAVRPVRLTHGGARALAFWPDGRALATGGFEGTVHIWDLPPTPVHGRATP